MLAPIDRSVVDLVWSAGGYPSAGAYLNTIRNRYFGVMSTSFQYFYFFGRPYRNQFFGQDLARAAITRILI